MHPRNFYLEQLSRFSNSPLIKVVTGLRRVGKSTILRLLRAQKLAEGHSVDRTLFIDMERMEFTDLRDPAALNRFVLAKTGAKRHRRESRPLPLFIDEVQVIPGWERAVNSLANSGDFDIYLSGSNANLLSSELASTLTGRYVEIPVYPLSFSEYALFRGKEPSEQLFAEFMKWGGMPGIHHLDFTDEVIYQTLASLVDSIVLKDIVARFNVRDVDLLGRILHFLADNSGSIFSAKRIADFMKKERRRAGVETVYNYLSHLQSAYLIHRVPRYDLKGKKLLEVHEKYFFADLGMKHALLGYREADISAALESVVYFELKRGGYRVMVGKTGAAEVDFIAEKGEERHYFQVCYLLADKKVVEREFAPLEAINDHYPKTLLSMDRLGGGGRSGIRREFLLDWLVGGAGLSFSTQIPPPIRE